MKMIIHEKYVNANSPHPFLSPLLNKERGWGEVKHGD
jgi:hypothetical protein